MPIHILSEGLFGEVKAVTFRRLHITGRSVMLKFNCATQTHEQLHQMHLDRCAKGCGNEWLQNGSSNGFLHILHIPFSIAVHVNYKILPIGSGSNGSHVVSDGKLGTMVTVAQLVLNTHQEMSACFLKMQYFYFIVACLLSSCINSFFYFLMAPVGFKQII